MCIGMCVDIRMRMCIDINMRVSLFIDMCVDMCVDMCIDMCIDMCTDMCIGMCTDMRVDMLMNKCIDTAGRGLRREGVYMRGFVNILVKGNQHFRHARERFSSRAAEARAPERGRRSPCKT